VEQYLQLECDMDFDTSGFQALIETVVRPVPLLPSLRCPIALSDLSLHGRLLIGFALCDEAPGVARIETSFVEPPSLEVHVSALGLPLTDVPGVEAWATRALGRVLATHFVEPKRARLNACRMFAKRTLGKQAGPGGTLCVAIIGASHMEARSTSVLPSAYVECRYAGTVRRTHVAPGTTEPHWGALLTFPVPGGDDSETHVLHARIIDWAEPGEPAVLGDLHIPFCGRETVIAVGEPLHTHTLRVHSSSSTPQSHGSSTVTLQIGILQPGNEHHALSLAAEIATGRDKLRAHDTSIPQHPLTALPRPEAAAAPAPPGETTVDPVAERLSEGTKRAAVHDGSVHHAGSHSDEEDVGEEEGSMYAGTERPASPTHSMRGGVQHLHTRVDSYSSSHAPGSRRHQMPPRPGVARAGVTRQAKQAVTEILTTLAHGGSAATAIAQAARAATAIVAAANSHNASAASAAAANTNAVESTRSDTEASAFVPAGSASHGNAPTGSLDSFLGTTMVGHHSRSTSWDDIGLPPPGRHRTHALHAHETHGHRRSVSAGSSADGRLDFTEELTAPFPSDGAQHGHHHGGQGHTTQQLIQDLQHRIADEREARLQAQNRLRELEAAAHAAEQLRYAEDMRALVEGARFVMHTAKGVKQRFLWLHATRKCLCWCATPDKKFDPTVEKSHFVPVALLDRCELGTALFDAMLQSPPAGGGGGGNGTPVGGWRLSSKPGALPRDERSALSVVIKSTSKDAMDAGSVKPFPGALHLELPPGGNGRSGREWVTALNTLIRVTKEPGSAPMVLRPLAPATASGAAQGGAALLSGALAKHLVPTSSAAAAAGGAAAANGLMSPPPRQTPAPARLAAAAALALLGGPSHEETTSHPHASPTPSMRGRSPSPMGRVQLLRREGASHASGNIGGQQHFKGGAHGRGHTIDFGQMALGDGSHGDEDAPGMQPRALNLDSLSAVEADTGGPAVRQTP